MPKLSCVCTDKNLNKSTILQKQNKNVAYFPVDHPVGYVNTYVELGRWNVRNGKLWNDSYVILSKTS